MARSALILILALSLCVSVLAQGQSSWRDHEQKFEKKLNIVGAPPKDYQFKHATPEGHADSKEQMIWTDQEAYHDWVEKGYEHLVDLEDDMQKHPEAHLEELMDQAREAGEDVPVGFVPNVPGVVAHHDDKIDALETDDRFDEVGWPNEKRKRPKYRWRRWPPPPPPPYAPLGPCGPNAKAYRCNYWYSCCQCINHFYTPNPTATIGCKNIDDCARLPCETAVSPSAKNSRCVDQLGTRQCFCNAGYQGNPEVRCTNINDCSPFPCGQNAVCEDRVGYFVCKCKSGFTGNAQVKCHPIDDCYRNGVKSCGDNTICVDGVNSFTCKCLNGYEWTGGSNNNVPGGVDCTSINDCPGTCGPNTICTDKHLGVSCKCKAGYEGNPSSPGGCTDIDDCNPSRCGANTDCTDKVNGFDCACKPFYEGDPYGSGCTDIDDCFPSNQCKLNTRCINHEGVVNEECLCETGFVPQFSPGPKPALGENCVQVDECIPSACETADTNFICTDPPNSGPGTWTCACKPGYTGDPYPGGACTEINECLPNNPCGANAACTDAVNSYSCACLTGYSGDPYSACSDTDECAANPCGTTGTKCTTPNFNSFNCECLPGYEGNPYSAGGCTDIDECAAPGACGTDADCTPLPIGGGGGHTCSCPTTPTVKTGNPYVECLDMLYCAGAPKCAAQADCSEDLVQNTFKCTCKDGFAGDAYNAPGCLDIDECLTQPCGPNAVCTTPVVDSFTCTCKPGFEGDPYKASNPAGCTNIDYCAISPCGPQMICTDGVLSMRFCNCNPGYEFIDPLNPDNGCSEIDECLTIGCPSANTDCVDKLLGRTCTCKSGFEGDPEVVGGCTDIDECLIPGACGGNTNCQDIGPNNYTCECVPGFEGFPYSSGCTNIDDCWDRTWGNSTCGINTNCYDGIQSRTCECKIGYEGDPYAGCTPIDDCLRIPCGAFTTCTDKHLSRECECITGWEGDPNAGCTNIDDCDPFPCGNHTHCTDGNSTFTCECDNGYQGNPYSALGCVDIDECYLKKCDINAACTNTDGSFTCECNPGYGGDGLSCDNRAGVLMLYSYLQTYEDGRTDAYSIRLTVQPSAPVTVHLNNTNKAEVSLNLDKVVFTSATYSIPQSVIVTGLDDDIVDGDQQGQIKSSIESDDTYYVSIASLLKTVPVLNHDFGEQVGIWTNLNEALGPAGMTIPAVNESGTTDTYLIRLKSEPTANVTVRLESTNTAEVIMVTNELTFTPAAWNVFQTVTIQGVDDVLEDGDISVNIKHVFFSDDILYDEMKDSWNKTVEVVNKDDDPPTIPFPLISDVTSCTEAGGPITINGVHFGASPTVTVNGVACLTPVVTKADEQIVCDCQPGSGANLPVVVTSAVVQKVPFNEFFYIRVPGSLTFSPETLDANVITTITVTVQSGGGVAPASVFEINLPPTWRPVSPKVEKTVPNLGEANTAFVELPESLRIAIQFTPTFDSKTVAIGERFSIEISGLRVPSDVGPMDKISLFSHAQGTPQEGPVPNDNDVLIIDRPVAPSPPTFSTITQTTVRLHWSPPLNDNLSPVSSYVIYRGPNKETKEADTPADTLMLDVTGLEPNTQYFFAVSAVNAAGIGAASTVTNVITSYAAPNLTAISPSIGPAAGGNIITFHGHWFTDAVSNVRLLTVNDLDCTSTRVLVDASQVKCTAPAAKNLKAITKGKGVLETTFGITKSPDEYTFYPKPTITEIGPLTGPSGGGTLVTVRGQFFGLTANDVQYIAIGNVMCGSVLYRNSTFLSCVTQATPGREAYTAPIRVSIAGGMASSAKEFEYKQAVIKDFRPNGGPADGGTVVTIHGERFGRSQEDIVLITVNEIKCAKQQYISETEILCTTPAAAPFSNGLIGVESRMGGTITSFPFKYSYLSVEVPSLPVDVRKVDPSLGPMIGGTNVTITGHWLGRSVSDIRNITIAGTDCTNSKWYIDSMTIGCVTGESPITTGDVKVVTWAQGPDAKGTTKATYEYHYPDPEIEFIKPKTVKRAGQQPVSLRGRFFGAVDGKNSRVTISGVPCLSTTWVSETDLICNTPAYADFPERVDMRNLKMAVAIGSRTSGPQDVGFSYGDKDFLECPKPCGWQGNCIRGSCVCNLGYAGQPECDKRVVEQTKVFGSVAEADPSQQAYFELYCAAPPRFGQDVVVEVSSTDPGEGVVMANATRIRWIDANYTEMARVIVTGVADGERDGNVTFAINVTIAEGSEVFMGGPPLDFPKIVSHDSPPKFLGISPSAVPLNGGRVNLRMVNLDTFVRVETPNKTVDIVKRESHMVRRSAIRLMQVDDEALSPWLNSSMLNNTEEMIPEEDLTIEMPPHTKGYHRIDVINDGGTRSYEPEMLYFTDECIEPGTYGTKETGCKPCPKGSQCPGGNRVWTESGNWNPGEGSGFAAQCEPPLRCQGGRGEQCAFGYEGVMCGACIDGYTDFNGLCKECPQDARLMQNVVAALIVWGSLAMVGMWIKEQMIFSYTVLLFKSIAILGAVGETANYQVPFIMLEVYNACFIFLGDIRFLRPDCQWRFPYSVNYGLARAYNTAIFMPMFLGIGITWFLKWWWHKTTRDRPDQEYIAEIRSFYKNRYVRALIIWLSLIYFSVCSSSLASISCKKYPIGSYMIAYNAEKCYEGLGMQMITLASVICLVLLGLCFPVGFLIFLKRNKSRMFNVKDFQDKYNILYDFFRPQFWYLWFFDFMALGVLSGGRSSFYDDPKMVMAFSCLVFGLKFILILWKQPYSQGFINTTQAIMQIGYITATALNNIARSGELVEKPGKGNALMALTLFLVGVPAALMVVFVMYAIFFDLKFSETEDYKQLDDDIEFDDDHIDFSLDLDNIQIGSTESVGEEIDADDEEINWATTDGLKSGVSKYAEQGLAGSLAALTTAQEAVTEWGEDALAQVVVSESEYESDYDESEDSEAAARKHFIMVNTEFDPEQD